MYLSIITPVYNTAKYLPACLDSLLDQGVSYEDYEIILINDGSKDNSAEILDRYAAQYPNLRVVHKENSGVSATRNIALDMVQGDYIWFIDSDDFIERNVLPQIFRIIQEKQPQRIHTKMYHMKSDYFTPEEETLYREKKLVAGKSLICSALYRTECVNLGPTRFHPELTSNGDLVFSYELKKSLGGYINEAWLDEPIVYFYRKNGGSITYRPSAKKLNSSISLSAIMRNHALEGDDGFAEYTMVRYLYFSYHGIFQLPRSERKGWLRLMREKGVYPVTVSPEGCKYYRDHFSSMRIKGIHPLLYKWIPTPVGYAYVWIRSAASGIIRHMRKRKGTK